MRNPLPCLRAAAAALTLAAVAGCGQNGGGREASPIPRGEVPTVQRHLTDAALGSDSLADVLAHGQLLFESNFNTLDGAGRPETTGTGVPRGSRVFPQNTNRISGPDANSCAGCHNVPRSGGGGDIVADVFVLGQRFGFVNFDGSAGDGNAQHTLEGVANERNTLGMFGSGFIDLLAREMTFDLHAIRDAAIGAAIALGTDVTRSLDSKGVHFGSITAHPNGSLDTSLVEGVDADLTVKPFHQKGVVVSVRDFTLNAVNHHHGMQSVERFGSGTDPDNDGHADELSVADITALTLFQATLPVPGRVLPPDAAGQAAVAQGEGLFQNIGCTSCHVPTLRLSSPVYTEPNPFNPAGDLRISDVSIPYSVDLAAEGPGPHLGPQPDGSVLVPAYTDLKRHDMGPALDTEKLVQAGVPTKMWLTKKLWGFASEPPFLHNSRATLISEAILLHGGEAQGARDVYAALPAGQQAAVVEFLKTLQILPPNSPSTTATGAAPGPIGDAPAIESHVAQSDVDSGAVGVNDLIDAGKALFTARFNTLDGQGRPNTTGTGSPRATRSFPQNFNRISGPDSNSCAGCHNLPRIGAGGEIVTSVFVLGQRFPFVNFDGPPGEGDGFETHTLEGVADERNTLGMFGAGFIELLSREMTADLQAIRDRAISEAATQATDVSKSLDTKGVHFGTITAHPNGSLDTSAVEGVNADLVVRPFHQKGAVVSIREFTNNATNHHHGMQSSERFGAGLDPDGDGHVDELTVGDITALSVFQATLPVPGRVMPVDAHRWSAVSRGEALFGTLGCAVCHVPALRLASPIFTEPNPYNPPGNLRPSDVPHPLPIDLTVAGGPPHLPKDRDGSVMVPAFTDLKRHDMGPALDTEHVIQAGIPTKLWLTKKLWGFASEPPFLHNGRANLISEAVLLHGGEGQAARDAFAALDADDRACVLDFLDTLRILPEGETRLEIVKPDDPPK